MIYMRLSKLTVFSLILLSRHADAGPAAFDSLGHLIASSDTIVLGSFSASTVNGVILATIQPSQVLKGRISTNTSISVIWNPESYSGPVDAGSSMVEQGFGMFFLASSPRGYSIVPVMIGDANWHDVFINASALRESTPAVGGLGSNVQGAVLGELVSLVKAGQQIPFDLVDLFRQSSDPILVKAFQSFRTDQDINVVSIGVQGGLAAGDLPTLVYLQQNSQVLSKAARWEAILNETKIYFLNVSAEAVQILGNIAIDATRDTPQREAAAAALARMHTTASLPYLSKLLRSQDSFVQAMAVGGIACFANNVPIGSHEPAPGAWSYRTDDTIAHSAFDEGLIQSRPDYYVGFWQNWVQQNAALTSQ